MRERLRIGLAIWLILSFVYYCSTQYYESILEEARHRTSVEISRRDAEIAILEARIDKYQQAIGSCENFIIARDKSITRRTREDVEAACRDQLQSCIDVVDVKKFEDATR